MSDTLGFEIVSCVVEPLIQDYEFGGVKSATLIVKGRIQSFIWRPTSDPLMDRCDGFLAMAVEDAVTDEMQFGEAMIDAHEPELQAGTVVECLAMCSVERIPGRPGVEGLVLLRVSDTETYRRVGFFTINSPIVFEDVEALQITIV